MANNAINADGQKRRFALLSPAGYGQCWAARCNRGPASYAPYQIRKD